MTDWRERLSDGSTDPLGDVYDVVEGAGERGIGIGGTLLGGRLEVAPLTVAFRILAPCDDTHEDALRALLSSAPVALAVAGAGTDNSEGRVTRAALEACPIPRTLLEAEQRGWVQQLAAQWKRAEVAGLSEEIAQAFDRVAAELYALDLNALMDLEQDRRHLMDTEE